MRATGTGATEGARVEPPGRARRPALGYALALIAATLWSLNGSISRELLDDGIEAERLAQLRSLGSWAILVLVLALARPSLLRVRRADVGSLAFLGIAGLALVHVTYFVAIDHLEIGVALTIQYLAPLLLLLWLRAVHGRRLARGLWGAVALSIAGCFLAVRAYDVGSIDAVGVGAAVAAAITFALYMVGSERAGHDYEPVTTLAWAFGFASLFWALVAPLWTFPTGPVSSIDGALLGLGVIVIGTLLPFICMVSALRHIPAPRAAIVSTLEPVLAAAFAWVIHDEALAAVQIAGGAAILGAVVWVQSQQVDLEAEAAPPALREAR